MSHEFVSSSMGRKLVFYYWRFYVQNKYQDSEINRKVYFSYQPLFLEWHSPKNVLLFIGRNDFFLTESNSFRSYYVSWGNYSHCFFQYLALPPQLFFHYFLLFYTAFSTFLHCFLTFLHQFCSYSQVPLKLRLNASSRHGYTSKCLLN